jgi:hypothetical protein
MWASLMFKCKACYSTEFQLMLQPGFQGNVLIRNNEFHEVVVSVGSQEFVADLMFMNQFAVCKECGSIKCWEYFFPGSAEDRQQAATAQSEYLGS